MACRRPGTPEPPRAPIATKRHVSATASSMKRPELVRETSWPPTRIDTTGFRANWWIGSIAGPDSVATPLVLVVIRPDARLQTAPPAAPRPPNEASRSAREAERRTSLSGEFARDKGELRFKETVLAKSAGLRSRSPRRPRLRRIQSETRDWCEARGREPSRSPNRG